MNFKWLLLSFSGRIGRQTYWLTGGGLLLFLIVFSIFTSSLEESAAGILTLVAMLAVSYMGVALAAKRWHDRDKSAWWSLIAFVPIIGGIWMLIELGFLAGTRGPNRFGPDPIRPMPVVYQGQTYYRHASGRFTDVLGNPVTSAALIGALGAAYLATSATTDAWANPVFDRVENSPPNATNTDSASSSGSWWSSSRNDSGGSDGWSSAGDRGGGGGEGGD